MLIIKSHHYAGYLFAGFIAILPFVLLWPWVWHGQVLFWGTLLLQFWPWHTLVKTSLLSGAWPLWNPLLGTGTPLLANLQSAVFYPPNIIYLLMPVEHALTFSVGLHLSLAGLLMYGYGRYLKLSRLAATVAAMAYMLSGYLVGRTQFITMINAAAWFPLLLLLSDKLATQKAKGPTILGLALTLAVQLLAGHAQLWFYGLWLIGPYILFRRWQTAPAAAPGTPLLRSVTRLKPVGALALAVGLALLLSAVQILPTAEFVSQSPRSDGASRTFALTYSFWPWRLITLLAPTFFGSPAQGNYWGYANYWEDHAYVGVLPLLLAGVAIWHTLKARLWPAGAAGLANHPARQVVPFFAWLVPVSLLLAMGWNTPIYLWVFDTLPGFNLFQAPARLLIWYSLAVAVLAGAGAQFFQATTQNRPNWRRLLAACVALTLASFVVQPYLGGRSLTFVSATQSTGLLLIGSIGLLLIRPGQSWPKFEPLWQASVTLFLAVDLLLVAWPLLPMQPASIFTTPIASATFIKNRPDPHRFFVEAPFAYATIFSRYFRFKDFAPADESPWQNLKETLVPNFGVYAGLPSVNNDDPLVVGHWQQFIRQLANARPDSKNRLLALASAGYVLTDATGGNAAIYTAPNLGIRPVPNPLPRAYFVPHADYAATTAEIIAKLTHPSFDPRRTVVISSNGPQAPAENGNEPAPATGPVTIEAAGATQIRLWVDAPSRGFVVLTDTFYPGWQATINGKPAAILRANLAFRAVAVGPGRQTVRFYYRPASFTFGLWTSIVTCLIILLISGRLLWPRLKTKMQNNAKF